MTKISTDLFPEYLTMEELSRYCGMSICTLRNWKRSGMPYFKLGRSVRIKRSDFDAWVGRFQVNGPPESNRHRVALAEAIEEVKGR
ncbi:MAG: helix-turn-helix domain-containing protein [Syntrophobacteraceae bacterium]|jgi:excisionase family DNA binding protein